MLSHFTQTSGRLVCEGFSTTAAGLGDMVASSLPFGAGLMVASALSFGMGLASIFLTLACSARMCVDFSLVCLSPRRRCAYFDGV